MLTKDVLLLVDAIVQNIASSPAICLSILNIYSILFEVISTKISCILLHLIKSVASEAFVLPEERNEQLLWIVEAAPSIFCNKSKLIDGFISGEIAYIVSFSLLISYLFQFESQRSFSLAAIRKKDNINTCTKFDTSLFNTKYRSDEYL